MMILITSCSGNSPTVSSTIFHDTFNRANGEIGGDWIVLEGRPAPSIEENRLRGVHENRNPGAVINSTIPNRKLKITVDAETTSVTGAMKVAILFRTNSRFDIGYLAGISDRRKLLLSSQSGPIVESNRIEISPNKPYLLELIIMDKYFELNLSEKASGIKIGAISTTVSSGEPEGYNYGILFWDHPITYVDEYLIEAL